MGGMIEDFYSRSCIVGDVIVLDVDPVVGTVLRFDVDRREVDWPAGGTSAMTSLTNVTFVSSSM